MCLPALGHSLLLLENACAPSIAQLFYLVKWHELLNEGRMSEHVAWIGGSGCRRFQVSANERGVQDAVGGINSSDWQWIEPMGSLGLSDAQRLKGRAIASQPPVLLAGDGFWKVKGWGMGLLVMDGMRHHENSAPDAWLSQFAICAWIWLNYRGTMGAPLVYGALTSIQLLVEGNALLYGA